MDEVVQQVYETAVAPEAIGDLLMSWSKRVHESAGELPEEDAEMLTSHLERAAQVLTMQERLAEFEAPGFVLDREGAWPAFTVSEDERVVALNQQAADLYGLRAGSPLSELPFDQGMIDQIRGLLRRKPEPYVIGGYRDSSGRLIGVSVNRLPSRQLMVRTTDAGWRDGLAEDLHAVFGFTAAEADVVRLLMAGRQPSEIASERGSKLPTVRSQIRNIYEKTGARSQPELLRLLIGIADLGHLETFEGKPIIADTGCAPSAEQRHVYRLRDGRTLEYAVFGADSGRPVVFLHDTFFGVQWPADLVEQAENAGLRIFAPARPGYGRSSPHAQATLESVGLDVLEWLDVLGLEKTLVLARTNGLPYAVQLASMQPDRVVGIVALAPALPEMSAGKFRSDAFPPGSRRFVDRTSRAMLSFIGRCVDSLIRMRGLQSALAYYFQSAPRDVAVLRDDSAMQVISAGSAYAREQGGEAVLEDLWRCRNPSVSAYIGCPCRVCCLIGEEESNTRAQRLELLVRQGARFEMQTVAHSGELFFYSEPLRIVAALVRMWDAPDF